MLRAIEPFTPATTAVAPSANTAFTVVAWGAGLIFLGLLILIAVFEKPDRAPSKPRVVAVYTARASMLIGVATVTISFGALAFQDHALEVRNAAAEVHNTSGAAAWLSSTYGIATTSKAAGLLVNGHPIVFDIDGKSTRTHLVLVSPRSGPDGKVLVDDALRPVPTRNAAATLSSPSR